MGLSFLTIGALAFGVAIIGAAAAWITRETYRLRATELGDARGIIGLVQA